MALPGFIRVKGDVVYYAGTGEFLLFVPEVFFNRSIAVIEGEYVELIGILNYITNHDPSKSMKLSGLKTFYFPSRFITKPGSIEKVKNLQITKNYMADYRILHYTDNGEDQIIVSTKVPQDINNVEDFFRVFIDSGTIPNTIGAKEMYKYILDNMEINGNSYHLPCSLFGLLTSEICRNPNNENQPFRLCSDFDKNDYAYKPMSVKDIPKVVSPFTSITSENFDKAVVGAIMNKEKKNTPLERVLMG